MAWSTRHSDIQIGKDTLQWQRVYDQAGDWERQQIGPDLLPFAFPAESLDSLDSDMMDLLTQHQSYLLILTKESSCLSQILSDLDQAFEANSQIQLLLWNPDQGFELPRYSEQLESCNAPVVWLDESFSPAEQSCLLQQSRLMIDPTGQGYYYAHWAWFLGRPVIWTRAASFDAYPELAALYATVPFQDHFEPVDMQSVQRLQAALLKKQETLQAAWLNGLWQIKVRATLAY